MFPSPELSAKTVHGPATRRQHQYFIHTFIKIELALQALSLSENK